MRHISLISMCLSLWNIQSKKEWDTSHSFLFTLCKCGVLSNRKGRRHTSFLFIKTSSVHRSLQWLWFQWTGPWLTQTNSSKSWCSFNSCGVSSTCHIYMMPSPLNMQSISLFTFTAALNNKLYACFCLCTVTCNVFLHKNQFFPL